MDNTKEELRRENERRSAKAYYQRNKEAIQARRKAKKLQKEAGDFVQIEKKPITTVKGVDYRDYMREYMNRYWQTEKGKEYQKKYAPQANENSKKSYHKKKLLESQPVSQDFQPLSLEIPI